MFLHKAEGEGGSAIVKRPGNVLPQRHTFPTSGLLICKRKRTVYFVTHGLGKRKVHDKCGLLKRILLGSSSRASAMF